MTMLVSCQRHCNGLNARLNRSGRDNDCGSDTLNLPKPYSEAAETCQALPKFLLEIPTVPAGTAGTTVTGQPVLKNSADSIALTTWNAGWKRMNGFGYRAPCLRF
jgi:hypothetical protein